VLFRTPTSRGSMRSTNVGGGQTGMPHIRRTRTNIKLRTPTRPRYQWHISRIKSRFCRRVPTESQSVRVLIVDGVKRHEDEELQASLDMQCRASRYGRLPVGRNHSAVRDNDLVCGVPVLPPCGVRTRNMLFV
jgi:hypothetical protein